MKNRSRRVVSSKSCLQAAICFALANTVQAQSLDEQYSFFLGGNCSEMGFARDGGGILLPGQAGPRLKARCDGPAPVGGVLNFASNGGVSGVGTSAGAEDASARRKAAKDEASIDKRNAPDLSITRGGASLFLSLRYSSDEQDTTRFEGGRDSNSFAATLGADYRFGSKGMAGFAIRFEDVSGEFISGGDFESQAQGFVLYASFFPAEDLFVDFSFNRNFRNDDTHRIVSLNRILTQLNGTQSVTVQIPAATLDSERDGRDSRAQLQAGYDFSAGAFTFGPRFGVFSVSSILDEYGESGPTPMALIFDSQRESSLRSSVGMQAGRAFTPSAAILVLQANFDWLHEFQDDQRLSTARLVEDLRPNPTVFAFLNEAPDRNFYSARVSLSSVFRSGWAGFASVEGLLGHAYQQSVGIALGLRKEL